MVVRPLEIIISEIVREVQAALPNANVQPGSVIREALISPPAAQVSFLYQALEGVRQAQTITEATGGDLDRLASNFGLIRDSGRAAIGEVVLVISNTITSNDIVVPDRSTVSTDERTGTVQYVVIGSYILKSIDKDYYAAEAVRLKESLRLANITNAQYATTVPIQSLSLGNIGNVAAFSIIRGNIPGTTAIVNLNPTAGGTNSESDESLRRRISLVLTNASAGTTEGLIATALSNPVVTDAAVISPGNPLMTRDGSIYDEQGNLVKSGTGRDVDLYIRGKRPTSQVESYTFTDNSQQGETITLNNNYALGYVNTTTTNQFAQQPTEDIIDITGSVSGTNFKKAIYVTDDEDNVILDGSYVLLKDIQQELDTALKIVKNNETGEVKVAAYLNPLSNKYSVIESIEPSGLGNSALGRDSVLWLTNVATITDEVVTRGPEYNGSDTLTFTNVAQIQNVDEDVVLTKESVLITSQGVGQDAFIVYTKHVPIVSVSQVRHARLGFSYNCEILDANLGQIRLVGRFIPQAGDVIQISYSWRQRHVQNVEYFLQGDTVKWSRDPYERPVTEGTTLLTPTTLLPSLSVQVQPLIPTYLGIQADQLTARARYTMSFSGDKARIVNSQNIDYTAAPSFETDDFLFKVAISQSATATKSRLARVLAVRNLTKGFAYNIDNSSLNTNIYDPAVHVNENLADNEFLLDSRANTLHLEVGDKVLFSRKSSMRHWTTTEDFTNNIRDNIAPTFDPITTNIANDEITVKRPEDDTTSSATILSGSITQSGTLSGIVEIADNVIIEPSVLVVIQPNTVIRIRDSRSLDNSEVVQELMQLNNLIQVDDIDSAIDIVENDYVFDRPTGSTAPFFVILNDTGTETLSIYYDRDVIRKVVKTRDIGGLPQDYVYYINDRLIPDQFLGTSLGSGLIAAIDTSSIFLGYRLDTDTFVSHITFVSGRNQYGIFLTKIPKTTSIVSDDFSFYQASNPDALFTDVAYDSGRNVFLVGSLATESLYKVEYFVSIVKRLSIRVRGALQTAPETSDSTPIVFTSTSTDPLPGDWEGIIFDPSSHTNASGSMGVTSSLTDCIIKYARIGIQNHTSDPFIDRCLIKKCKDGGYTAVSSFYKINGYTRTNLRLLSNDFTATGRSYIEDRYEDDGYGYGPVVLTSDHTLSFLLNDLLSTAQGTVSLFEKVGNWVSAGTDIITKEHFTSKYSTGLIEGSDFKVYVDGVYIVPGVNADFDIEYDKQRGGFLLSFFNTTRTMAFLAATVGNNNTITVDYYAAYQNGTISNSVLVDNGNNAISLNLLSAVSVRNNTIHHNGFYGLAIENAYVRLANNLITGYDISPVFQSVRSLFIGTTNDMWSLPVTNAEQNEIADVDILTNDVAVSDTIIIVEHPELYKRNSIIKIDNETMQVQDVLNDRLLVIRGYNETLPTTHKMGGDILIQRIKFVFTVTGVPGNLCLIRETSSDGSLISGREPVTMIKIADNTFRIAFSVDRSATFFYRFQYKQELTDPWWLLSETRRLPIYQFGSAINNFISPDHEISITIGTSNDFTNYSDNPKYGQSLTEDFSIPSDSPASMDNPIYATPHDPTEPRLRFLGRRQVIRDVNLTIGTSSITLNSAPIIVTNLQTDIQISSISNPDRRLLPGSYDSSTKRLTLSAPVTSSEVGAYNVTYNTPRTLGTSMSAFPLSTAVTYRYNENKVVDFTKLEWRLIGGSGKVRARFRTANSTEDIELVNFGSYSDTTPFDLSWGTGNYPRGSVIDIDLLIETNDAGFTSAGVPIFPKLQDFSLFLTPARDNVLYKVLNTLYDVKSDRTVVSIEDDENVGLGIRTSTFVTVGTDDSLSLIVRKAIDNFEENQEFVIGEMEAIAAESNTIKAIGNVILERIAPDSNDQVVADLIYADVEDSEEIVFIENGTQITRDKFYSINNIQTQVILDKVKSIPTTEVISVVSLEQPAAGAQYLVDYTFAAPVDNETVTVTYTYNDTVRVVAQMVEAKRVLTSDILTRAGVEVPIRIEAKIFMNSGYNASALVIDITNALSNYFNGLVMFGGIIAPDFIESLMTNVTGVASVKLNVLSRTLKAVVETITLTDREYAALASSNPLLTVVEAANPDKILTTNSV